MDFSRLLARVKSILLTPKTEWPVIAAEPATTVGIYTSYVLLLAALGAICQFLKLPNQLLIISCPLYGFLMVGNAFSCALRVGEWAWASALLDEWLANEITGAMLGYVGVGACTVRPEAASRIVAVAAQDDRDVCGGRLGS